MSNIARPLSKVVLSSAVGLIACLLGLEAAVPKGWRIAGTQPQLYEAGVEQVSIRMRVPEGSVAGNGLPSAYLKSKRPISGGFGTLMQNFPAGRYAGHRIRFTAFVRTEHVQDWAGLWMRIDTRGFSKLANGQDRPIKGTTDWRRYGITLDVPPKATRVAFGVLLAGSGTVWINRVEIEAVGLDVPTIDPKHHEGPVNLDFQSQ